MRFQPALLIVGMVLFGCRDPERETPFEPLSLERIKSTLLPVQPAVGIILHRNIRCVVEGEYVTCYDEGPTCKRINEIDRAYYDRIFGCIDPASKNYPCKEADNNSPPLNGDKRWDSSLRFWCQPQTHRSLNCDDDFTNCR